MTAFLIDYLRLIKVGSALARYDVILPGDYHRRLPLIAQFGGAVMRLFGGRASGRQGERLARALEQLGPTYIKLGQFLATRPDVFGVEVTTDLSRLKDKLPAFPATQARSALDTEFGETQSQELFPELSEAIAAASLAQVHKLKIGDQYKAVKILRPNIERRITKDLRAIKRAARLAERISPSSRRMRPVAFTETVSASMEKELDLRLEAGGGDELRDIALNDNYVHIPAIDWTRSGQRVLTTEWIDGRPLTAPDALDQAGLDRAELATRVTRGFLSQAINYGVFHADMHEGNMIVMPDGHLALVDFGLIGRVGIAERRFLAEILWGFIQRDYKRIAEVHFEAGYVPADRSVGDFAQALRSVGEPIHGKNAADVSMSRLLLQLLDFTHIFGMQLRPELVLLQKTMVQVEGVARTIDPHHDIWAAADPIVKDWIKNNLGPVGAAKLSLETVSDVTDRLKRLPQIMDKLEAHLNQSGSEIRPSHQFPWWAWVIFGAGLTGALVALLN
ncbi:MAG: AarF/UbiB family protein [Henriciella sp.]